MINITLCFIRPAHWPYNLPVLCTWNHISVNWQLFHVSFLELNEQFQLWATRANDQSAVPIFETIVPRMRSETFATRHAAPIALHERCKNDLPQPRTIGSLQKRRTHTHPCICTVSGVHLSYEMHDDALPGTIALDCPWPTVLNSKITMQYLVLIVVFTDRNTG